MRRVLTPGWVACHVLMVTLVAGMLGLATWQYVRAAGGNALSWGYFLQWPVFAGFTVYIWWREVRRVVRSDDPADDGRAAAPADAPEPLAPMLAPAPSPGSSPAVGTAGSTAPRDDTGRSVAPRRPVITRRPAPVTVPDDDPELARYNHYLEWLRTHPGARPVDYPG